MNNCWICKTETADTREHEIKQTDVRGLFGSGPYPKGKRLKKTGEGQKGRLIQSEDSVHIKYRQSLCKHCNSTRSQPWDEAYKTFMSFIHKNGIEIQKTKHLEIKQICPNETSQFVVNLYSYFIKAFGCQLFEHGQGVPDEISEYLLGNQQQTNLLLSFAVYESFPSQLTSPIIQVHKLEGDVEVSTGKPCNYTWAMSLEWLTIIIWYNKQPAESLGEPWNGSSVIIKMGSYKDIENS